MELNKISFFKNKKQKSCLRKTFHNKKVFSCESEWIYEYFQKNLTLK